MATYIVQYCTERGYDDTVMLATTTVSLAMATAMLGLCLWVIGLCGGAQLIQLLPTCVVGGYLAYIGWFCGMAGICLMSHSSSVSLAVIKNNWIHILPGVLGGIGVYTLARWLRHMAVLPTCIVALLSSFYIALWYTDTSIAEASANGWMVSTMDTSSSSSNGDGVPPSSSQWTDTWNYLRLDQVAWSVLPDLLWTELSMIFVVAVSSSLDVAAIELELKRPLDYNGELKMVGISNLISGLTGGYTGSYIFSQTIFSLRAGIRSRLAGYVLALVQAGAFLLPVPIVAYVPAIFFGALLCMICVDLIYEWLWDVRHKLTPVEYMICLATFVSIQITGVESGILAGVVFHVIGQSLGLRVGEQQQEEQQQQEQQPEDEPMSTTTGTSTKTTTNSTGEFTETSALLQRTSVKHHKTVEEEEGVGRSHPTCLEYGAVTPSSLSLPDENTK